MSRFVLDCSVTMSWCFEDEVDAYADGILERLGDDVAVVPALWALEVANALLIAERRMRISPARSARFISLLDSLPIVLVDLTMTQVVTEVVALGRAHRLSAYDAAYLATAMGHGLPLASRDRALCSAAGACGVPLFPPRQVD